MTLRHATMIAGLAAALLPLLLQRLARSRVRPIEWGAMMFLEDAPGSGKPSASRREWALLLVRILMIAALAMALAQPVAADGGAAQGAGLTLIILDRSGSMSVEAGDKSRLELARRAALNILAALPAGDEAAVIFTPEAFGSTITSDFQQVAARISDIRQSNGRADLAGALNTASRLLTSSHSSRRNLFLIADCQASSFRDMTDSFAQSFRAQLGSTPPKLRFVPIGNAASNCALLSAEVIDPHITAGKPVALEIKVANYSAAPRVGLPLTIALGEQVLDSSELTVPGNSTAAVRRSIQLSATGSQLLTLKIGEDAYTADDSLDVAVLAQPPGATPQPLPDQNLSVGDVIVADLPGALPDRMTIDGPGSGPVDSVAIPHGMQARYSATGRPGAYRLHYQTAAGPQTLHFVVRSPREESDLNDLSAAALKQICQQFGFDTVRDSTAAAIGSEINPNRVEPWLVLVCLTVLLAALEAGLSHLWVLPAPGAAR